MIATVFAGAWRMEGIGVLKFEVSRKKVRVEFGPERSAVLR